MIKVGITGQAGFIGTHLFNYLNLKEDVQTIPFQDDFFDDENRLDDFVRQCDVVVHLAAMNRHPDPKVIYKTNIGLVKKLVASFDRTGQRPHLLFSSSTQESMDNLYGKSKKDGRKILSDWAKNAGAKFTGLIIPNVFGPFGRPFYNSVVPTFCHQLTHGESPEIIVDNQIKLIYVNDLTTYIYQIIIGKTKENPVLLPHTGELKVSELLQKIKGYKTKYMDQGIIPDLTNDFDRALFNTFRCYVPDDYFPRALKLNTDNRGAFVETVKAETPGQFSYSTTKPGITRGNHFHTRKAERFIVIKGKAKIQLRKFGTDEIIEYELSGDQPSYVDMPVWFTHNITNTGNEELFTLFWINEPFDPDDPDTYFEKV